MRLSLLLCLSFFLAAPARGQQYELIEPQGRVGARIQIDRGQLSLREGNGQRLQYSRERRYDSPDGKFLGYANFEVNRVLRFPSSGQGKLQVADLNDANPRFQYSIRVVRPASNPTNEDRYSNRSLLPGQPRVSHSDYSDYEIPLAGDAYIDRGLHPLLPNGAPLALYPQSVLVDSKIIPDPPLAPVRVELFNGGPRDIQVGIVDLRDPSATRSLRIEPRTVSEIRLARQPGGRRIDTYRLVSFDGEAGTKEIVRRIPPLVRYEIVVHEWAMQSIAIDRTGKSPDAIEDVNFEGRGLGRFRLPPGEGLQPGRIDVFRAAIRSGLQETVAPIPPADEPIGGSPLEQAIFEAQQRARTGR